jgi:hypothetical protein
LPKPLSELRSWLSRTGAAVSSANPARLLPRALASAGRAPSEPGEEDQENGSRFGGWRPRLPGVAIDRTAVALSLEGSSVRFLTTSRDRVVGWSTVPLLDRAGSSGQINDPLALGSAIDGAFEEFQLSRRRVSWALPGFGVTSRLVELPNLRESDLQEAVSEEFDRVLGVSLDDYYLFWERLTGRIRQRMVFALAVPKSGVLAALEALDVASIKPRSMDLRPLALARAVGRADAIITNLEDGSMDVVIVERGVPAAIRSVPIPGSSVAREVAQNRLIEETERALAYYDDANPDHPLDDDTPIYLTGSWATGIALAERIRSVTRHPIGRFKPDGVYPPELPITEYAVNLGLALKRG